MYNNQPIKNIIYKGIKKNRLVAHDVSMLCTLLVPISPDHFTLPRLRNIKTSPSLSPGGGRVWPAGKVMGERPACRGL